MSVDFPTLERPRKTTSPAEGFGSSSARTVARSKRHSVMRMGQCVTGPPDGRVSSAPASASGIAGGRIEPASAMSRT